ncbi:MAG TPA: GxxExxY protein [Phycisphaerales bacterium]|nr:GxxExxY protein [Phycisphaerales bacterium]
MNNDRLPLTHEHDALTEQIIGAAIDVHRELGPGLLESCYETCLLHELSLRGLSAQRQLGLPVEYKGVRVDCGFRIDILVEGQVVVELKAVDKSTPIDEAQLITYLKLSGHRRGLLINFNVRTLKDGLMRRGV